MDVLDFPSTHLSRELAECYGYDEFIIRRWFGIFGDEAVELIEAMEKGVPKYIRVNTLKIEEKELIRRLEKRKFVVEQTEVPFCYKVVGEPYSIGATPEYLMGYYYVMDKASCIPPLALSPSSRDVVVDFAASPGGKTTFLAQLMGNRGVLLAIEANPDRIQPLIDNIHRMGVLNAAVVQMNAAKFHKIGIKPDKILLDAPCSGEGIIHKDPSRKTSRGEEDILFCSGLQRDLIDSAIRSLKSGGALVYSTCSLTPEENEMVIQWALDNHPVRLEKIEWGDPALTKVGDIRFSNEMKKARRFYPHRHECSGFFVAKLVKE
ncbi:NOL1/NOP2/sun family putative RNA methylase [Archaeoglobus veneficus]|uniref:RNA methylase, NOL1/NOP2/sun family n=1 Tax=Archaeoglobus veneficus (strain DSM 11195 / SNP6) TaxID=693661 RepID=F2KPE3_ARCVS|nr:NOL1/NOP2/sun family putative RNA methylase [Archaeoglobus veneficus]AEA46374.1 RNA methylase, NOL1/NOP2/sun family [Archaeoglobus veneficus SNP6]